jgi:3-deoxy-D-manno-octulosonic-acid transferase
VGAIDQADAERLVALGVRADRVRVTGDTRYDQVWRRALAASLELPPLAPLAAARGSRFTVVAGSTWPADEAALREGWAMVRRQDARARLVLAPHEPTPSHLAPIEAWAAADGLRVARLSALVARGSGADADLVVVDSVGVLGELYAVADAAFVGGGFHSAGLHSVLEPAAYGLPVAFGPQHQGSRDAGLLLAAGGGASVATGRTLGELLRRWQASQTLRTHAGAQARAVVERALGADRRAWALVASLLPG